MIKVAILPASQPEYESAVVSGGGEIAGLADGATGLVWTDSQGVTALADLLDVNPQVDWVQLPFAGVDNFKALFDSVLGQMRPITFTSAKGSYREPVAEHALMLALALARAIPERLAAKTWGRKFAATLFDANVLIVGGGGIATELIRLIKPFRPSISVVRRDVQPMMDTARVADLDQLDDLLAKAMASALDQSTGALPSRITARLAQMREQALAHQKQWQSALQLAGQGTHRAIGSLLGDSFGSGTDWRRWAASFGVLVMTAVFMFWQAQNQVEQLASEDSALLSEALPPSALLDKGFQSWVSSGTPDIQ